MKHRSWEKGDRLIYDPFFSFPKPLITFISVVGGDTNWRIASKTTLNWESYEGGKGTG